MRREAPRAAPKIDKQEGRKNELEIKMRNGGLLSSELLELQTIRAEIASAAAEEEAQKQAMKEQFKREIEEEDKRAAERLVRLEQEAIAREIQALSIKKEHKEREAKLNSRPESRPPRRTTIGIGPGLTAPYSHDHLYIKGPERERIHLTKPPWMIRQEKEWAAEAKEREYMLEEEQRCIKAWEAAAVLASGMVDILNNIVDDLMWKYLEFLEWERERIRIELGEMAMADAESELAMEAYRQSEQFAADERQKTRLLRYRVWCKQKWKWIPSSDYHSPKRRSVDWDCSNCNQLNKQLLFVCATCGFKRLDDEIQYEKDVRDGKYDESDDEDASNHGSGASSSSDESFKIKESRQRFDMFSPGRVEHTAKGTRSGDTEAVVHGKPRMTPAEKSNERRLKLRRDRGKRLNPVAFARSEGLKGMQSQKSIQSALDEGNPAPIIKEMRRNRDNTHVQAAGCSGLGLLAATGPVKRVIDLGGVKSIVRAMEAHEDSVLLQRAACKSLYILAAGIEAKSKAEVSGKELLASVVRQINDLGGSHSVAVAANSFPSDRVVRWATDKLSALMQRQRAEAMAVQHSAYVVKCQEASGVLNKCIRKWPEADCHGIGVFRGFDDFQTAGKAAVKLLPNNDIYRSDIEKALKDSAADTLESGLNILRGTFESFINSVLVLSNDLLQQSSVASIDELDNLEHQRAVAEMRERQRWRNHSSSTGPGRDGKVSLFSSGGSSRALSPLRHQPDMLEGFVPLDFHSNTSSSGAAGTFEPDEKNKTNERVRRRESFTDNARENLSKINGIASREISQTPTFDRNTVNKQHRGDLLGSRASASAGAFSDYGWDTTPPSSREKVSQHRQSGRSSLLDSAESYPLMASQGPGLEHIRKRSGQRAGSDHRFRHRVNAGSRGTKKISSEGSRHSKRFNVMEQTQFESCMNVANEYFSRLDKEVNALRAMVPPEPKPILKPKQPDYVPLTAAEIARLQREWRVGRHNVIPDWLESKERKLDFESYYPDK